MSTQTIAVLALLFMFRTPSEDTIALDAIIQQEVQASITIVESQKTMSINDEDTTEPLEETPIDGEHLTVSEEDIKLLVLVTMAEAEGECDEGKRLVVSTILNRVDSPYFPDTIRDVIYQKNQFSSMWNGRIDRVTDPEEVYILVRDEIKNRSNYDVVFFTAGQYGKYGTPEFKVENHYFSSY